MHDPYEFVRQAKNYLDDSHHNVDEAIRRLKERYPGIPYGIVQNVIHIALNESLMEGLESPSGLAGMLIVFHAHDMDTVRNELKERGLNEDQIIDAIHVAEAELKQKATNAVIRPEILERQALDILILSGGIESQAYADLNSSFPYLADHIIEKAVQSAMARYPQDTAKRMRENPTLLLAYVKYCMRSSRDRIVEDVKNRYPHIGANEIRDAIDTIGSEMYG